MCARASITPSYSTVSPCAGCEQYTVLAHGGLRLAERSRRPRTLATVPTGWASFMPSAPWTPPSGPREQRLNPPVLLNPPVFFNTPSAQSSGTVWLQLLVSASLYGFHKNVPSKLFMLPQMQWHTPGYRYASHTGPLVWLGTKPHPKSKRIGVRRVNGGEHRRCAGSDESDQLIFTLFYTFLQVMILHITHVPGYPHRTLLCIVMA